MTTSIKRRALGSAGAAALVAAGLSTAIAAAPSASAATSPALNYNCTVTIFGAAVPQGVWTATVTADVPTSVAPGAAIPAPSISAKVVTNAGSGDTLRFLNISSLSGTSTANYTFGGKEQTAQLTIPTTKVPASGVVTTVASGKGEAATAPTTAGPVVVKVGDFTADLTYTTGAATGQMKLACNLVPGQNTTLATIYVGSSSPTSSASPSSSSSAPTGSSSSPAPAKSSATAPTTTTGPAVVTDGGASGGDSNALVAAGAAAVAIGAGAGAFGLRRRMRG
ncbi:DUF6801 domain-containing protein [Rudaeicoccus suwonensis]|uniref:DUF6801 domain-containing protein n=1 Tax=Rudaeicoccus suwonensis TaxID=657409 RepID=A0A561E2V6_9MICO|nr:DUF6801 domain-containing protein [Rudaeicoccus suwonensis]TWE09944.1 hypothetical protein BKA23_2289 [Rudaeicoccus suwonensis]